MKRLLAALLLLECLLLPLHGAIDAILDSDGTCTFTRDGVLVGSVYPGYYLPHWSTRSFHADYGKAPQGNVLSILGGETKDPVRVALRLEHEQVSDRTLRFVFTFTPKADLEAMCIHASASFPATQIAGRDYLADGKKCGTVPEKLQEVIHLYNGKVTDFTLKAAVGDITLHYDAPFPVLLQDNRRWGDNIGVRMASHSEQSKLWKGGVPYRVAVNITFPETVNFSLDVPFNLQAGPDWIPLVYDSLEIEKDSALDFTSVLKNNVPAGTYGYVRAVGQNFEYEKLPGVPQRFYGVNFCFSAHNITPEQSEILATRLQRLGYNAVRYHHYERDITNTKLPGDSTQLDPDKIALFDAMFAAMKKHGLYATTDLFVSRPVYASEVFADGKNTEHIPQQAYKRLLPFSKMAMDNWKAFARSLLTHVNPHTGLSYAQDPALGLISLINEGTLDGFGALSANGTDQRQRQVYLDAWNAWLAKKYATPAARNQAWNVTRDDVLNEFVPAKSSPQAARDFQQFLAEAEINMIQEMKRFLREDLGCRALITDINCGGKSVWAQLARAQMDYVDDHFYVDHPSFLVNKWSLPSRCSNTSVVKSGLPGGLSCTFSRIIDKPFTITEWNYSGPGRYRGVGGILTGCLAAIQNWSGMWRFAYSHGKSMFSPRTAGYFDLVSDPLNQCADRASILLYLRGDLASATHTVTAAITPDHALDSRNQLHSTVPNWKSLGLLAKMGVSVGTKNDAVPLTDISVSYSYDAPQAKIAFTDPETARAKETTDKLFAAMKQLGWLPAANRTDPAKNISQTPDGQFTMDGSADTMILNTPRTAGCFAPAGTTIDTDAIRVTILDTDATVWVSSLSDAPVRTSRRLLLTHLTDLQNTNQRYQERARKTVLSWGKLPHLVHNGRADVLLKLANPAAAKVWALDINGKRLAPCPATVTPDGLQLSIAINSQPNAQLLYEITLD